MSKAEHKIPCPKCHRPLRHRALSGLYWCANSLCPTYKGVPPIKVNFTTNKDLIHAMSEEVWAKIEKDA